MLLPPAQSLEKLSGHGQPVILQTAALPLAGSKVDPAITEVHIFPAQTEKLAAPRSQMQIGQQQEKFTPNSADTAARPAPLPQEEPFLPANEDRPPESSAAVSDDMGAEEDTASERRPRFGPG